MILWYFHYLHTFRAFATIKVHTLLLFQEFESFHNLKGILHLTITHKLHMVGSEE